MLEVGSVLPPPPALRDHVYERHLSPPGGRYRPLVESMEATDGLDRLDPVCLMDVDPTTARHTVEYEGRTIAFCGTRILTSARIDFTSIWISSMRKINPSVEPLFPASRNRGRSPVS